MLKDNSTLTSLDLSDNKIGETGARDLAASLKDNNSLTELNLSSNNIGDTTLKTINGYLQRNKTIAEKKSRKLKCRG
ncbi:leucine Rich repeat family protein [Rickettsia endosymbiont of Ixodes pacificus]|nr:leucine Rich repeat family protein [Rickettsia endosymbiont of Ixodes pacificus]